MLAGPLLQYVSCMAFVLLLRAAATPGPDAPRPTPFQAPEYVIGSTRAPVTLVEYLSDTCSHCAAFDHNVYPQILSDYIETGRVRFLIRELPTAPTVVSSAGFLFARCRGQADYWAAVRRLLDRQSFVLAGQDQADQIGRAASVVGLSPDEARVCLSDQTAISALDDRRLAALDLGADSTPTFVVNGRLLRAGSTLAGATYEGGELSMSQFADAVRQASWAGDVRATPPSRAHHRSKPSRSVRPAPRPQA